MPFRSESQRRKFFVLRDQGKIGQGTLDEFQDASRGLNLPDRVGKPRRFKNIGRMLGNDN